MLFYQHIMQPFYSIMPIIIVGNCNIFGVRMFFWILCSTVALSDGLRNVQSVQMHTPHLIYRTKGAPHLSCRT